MTRQSPELRGVYLFAASVRSSVEFYQRLGLTIETISDEFARANSSNGTVLEIGSANLTSSYDPAWQPPGHPSKNTINFELPSSQDVDDTYHRMIAAGYTGQLEPCEPPWQARFAIMLDPDGNLVGLHGPRDQAADREREQSAGRPTPA